jgi:hypothetical protein
MFSLADAEDDEGRVVEVQLKTCAFFVKKWKGGTAYKDLAFNGEKQAHSWSRNHRGPSTVWEEVKERLGGWVRAELPE